MERHAGKAAVGEILPPFELVSVAGRSVQIPDPQGKVHLQFRRYAGCVICNLHIRSFARRHAEISAAGIREVVLFHSSEDSLKKYYEDLPFDLVADPERRLYRAFAVGTSMRAVLNPKAWQAAARGMRDMRPALPEQGESLYGLPADILIDGSGRVLASKYGEHADDQWTVDELLSLAAMQGATAA